MRRCCLEVEIKKKEVGNKKEYLNFFFSFFVFYDFFFDIILS